MLEKYGVEMIGAEAEVIDKAEDRQKFRDAMDHLGLESPKSKAAHTLDEALEGLEFVGLPAMLLVVPQFTVWTYALVWLISARGWSTTSAGLLIALTQVLGALGRLGAGQLSDLVGSRMRPLRWVAVAAAATMAALALTDRLDWSVAVAIMVIASVITVADNGLAFTSIAEVSGPFWSGRALGTQNTAQFLTASLVPPALGALISSLGFPAAFAITALCPLVAVPLVPTRSERPTT